MDKQESRFQGEAIQLIKRDRVRLSLAAYFSEILEMEYMPDKDFNALARKVQKTKNIKTDSVDDVLYSSVDNFKKRDWIHVHPDLQLIAWLALTILKLKKKNDLLKPS